MSIPKTVLPLDVVHVPAKWFSGRVLSSMVRTDCLLRKPFVSPCRLINSEWPADKFQVMSFPFCKKKKQTHSTAWISHAFSHIELSLGSRCRCSYRSYIHSTASSLPVLEYSYLFCEFEGSGLVFNLVWVLLDYFLSWIETNPREFGYII